jgi:hypothetical protein
MKDTLEDSEETLVVYNEDREAGKEAFTLESSKMDLKLPFNPTVKENS